MADGVFRAVVVTPEARLLDVPARAVVIRSSEGFLTVLDGHTPLVTDVISCDVRVDPEEGDPVHLAVHGGYLQVETGHGVDGDGEATAGASGTDRATRATLLAGVAELAGEIDVPRAEEAKAASQARVDELRAATGRTGGTAAPAEGEEAPSSPEELELAEAESALARAELRLAVAVGTAH